jgi:hypothetical protein
MMYVNGDSWTWDQDLHRTDLWPNIVAKHLGMQCRNESMGCGSNGRIVDNLKNLFIQQQTPELIVIGLTASHRYHIPAPNFGSWSIGPITALYDQTGEKNDTIKEFIFKYCHNEIDSLYRYYRDIWTIHMLCQNHNCRYLLVQIWDTSIENNAILHSTENIHNFVSKYFPKNTYDWDRYVRAFEYLKIHSQEWNYVESAASKRLDKKTDIDQTGHPNSNGHKKIADYVISLLERTNKK